MKRHGPERDDLRTIPVEAARLSPGGDILPHLLARPVRLAVLPEFAPVEVYGLLYLPTEGFETAEGLRARAYELKPAGGYAFSARSVASLAELREVSDAGDYEGLIIEWQGRGYVMTRPVWLVGENAEAARKAA